MLSSSRIAFAFAFAFAFSIAACNDGFKVADPCDDPDSQECRCLLDPSLPECPKEQCQDDPECPPADDCNLGFCVSGVCETRNICEGAVATAEIDATLNSNGSLFIQTVYSDDPAFTDALGAHLAADDGLAINECVHLPPPIGGPQITGQSVGTVQASRGGTLLLELVQEPNGTYEAFTAAGLVAFGEVIDVGLSGSDVIAAASLDAAIVIPDAKPSITDPVTNGNVSLARTIHYASQAVDFLKIRFTFIGTGNQIITIVCRLDPAGTSITLPQADFDELPQNGTIFLDAFNRTTKPLDAADGVARTIVSTTSVSGSQSYAKP